MTTLKWAQERLANTQRISKLPMPTEDRAGWIEDCRYWEAIVSDLLELGRVRERLEAAMSPQ